MHSLNGVTPAIHYSQSQAAVRPHAIRFTKDNSRSNGPAGDLVPGAGEHLQLGDRQRAESRGAHCSRDLGPFHLSSPSHHLYLTSIDKDMSDH